METVLKAGINIHNSAYRAYPATDLQKNLDTCVDLGLDVIRYNNSCRTPEALKEVKKVADLCHARGMKLMLVVDFEWYSETGTPKEIETGMADFYRGLSSFLRDAVDYYQPFNEMDVYCMGGNIANIFLTPTDGREKGEYDCVLWERSIAAVKGALRGMKEGYPEGKICINFAWWHTALIYEMYRQGCRWDITGIDWYSDCEEVSSIELVMRDILEHIPDCDLMICETNYWMNLHERYSEEQKQNLKTTEYRNKEQREWVPSFLNTLAQISNPRLKAVIFYELLDEPAYEREQKEYTGESHFGFIECDENGGNQVRKPVFYALQERLKKCDAIAKTG